MMNSGPSYIEETISREGDSTYNATASNLSEFLTKATKGFYIGRFEARVEEASLDTTGWGNGLQAQSANWTGYANGKLVEKGNSQVFNYITQSKASELSRGMYTSNSLVSDLINSYAWDTTLLFLQEFGEANYSIKPSVNCAINISWNISTNANRRKWNTFKSYTGKRRNSSRRSTRRKRLMECSKNNR